MIVILPFSKFYNHSTAHLNLLLIQFSLEWIFNYSIPRRDLFTNVKTEGAKYLEDNRGRTGEKETDWVS